MYPQSMRSSLRLTLAALALLPVLSANAQQGRGPRPDATPAAATPAADAAKSPMANPLPADAHVAQTVEVDGKSLKYTATVGTLPVLNAEGKATGEVVFTSYIVDTPEKSPARPVTFAFNGGPGAASVYLNLGAIGPKRVAFGAEGQSPSDPATLTDNPGTWLDFTDLVFIDPIGTGFSRSLVTPAESKTLFFGADQDIAYLSKIVFDWLVKNGRLQSRKYIVGESYGGYRGPRLTAYLQSQIGVARPLTRPVDDHSAFHRRRQLRASGQADRRQHGPGDRIHPH
jgi:carboxypeptidase C (cathepsin A)